MSQLLTDAIEKAVNSEDNKPSTAVNAVETKPAAETTEETPTKETEANSDKSTTATQEDVDIQQAKQLWQALKNPDQAPTVIKFLAEQAGYAKAPETIKEVKQQVKGIEDFLKEELGQEFDFLAPKIGKGLKQYLDQELNAREAVINQRIEAQETHHYATEAKVATDKISEQFFDGKDIPKDIEAEMSNLMDRYPPSATTSVRDYMNDIFSMVAGKRGLTSKKSSAAINTERTNKNRTDAPSRLASQAGATSPKADSNVPTKLTLDQAVRAAAESSQKLLD